MIDLRVTPEGEVFPRARDGTRTLMFGGQDADAQLVVTEDAPADPRIAVIRTSDRSTFRGCRRRWDLNMELVHFGSEPESTLHLKIFTGITTLDIRRMLLMPS